MLKRCVAKERRNARERKAEPQKVTQNGTRRSLVARSFDRFAAEVTKWAGSPVAFAIALCAVVLWGISGPAFGYSETWQLVINTGTTIVTFLMVFLIQQSQNKDSEALHLKLDELLIAVEGADVDLVNAERLDEDKLLALVAACTARARTQRRRNTRSLTPKKSRQTLLRNRSR
ncbi:low affinity iron permease family protein [Achromobacter insolitus]|uniref:low affinity iron permease family protein n=1 Tax=Achromobacter insolitus TaxID=217204 RepID=UPI00174B039A